MFVKPNEPELVAAFPIRKPAGGEMMGDGLPHFVDRISATVGIEP